MIRDMIRDPSDIASRVREESNRLAERAQEARRAVRVRLYEAREQGERGLFDLHVGAVAAAGGLIDRTNGVPVLQNVGDSARDLLKVVEKVTIEPPLAGYTDRNVRQILAELRDLDHIGLLRVKRFEADNRGRKTVLEGVDRELARRARVIAAS